MKGKYFLDEIDDIVYSTNSYEIHIMYHNLFYHDEYKRIMYPPDPYRYAKGTQGPPATPDDYITALKQVKLFYDNGWVPDSFIEAKPGCKKLVWVKHPEKATRFLKHSNLAKKLERGLYEI